MAICLSPTLLNLNNFENSLIDIEKDRIVKNFSYLKRYLILNL